MALDIDHLYSRYGPMVNRRCLRLLRDPEEAVDAMQDVFVQLLRRQDRLDMSAPSSLLYKIATDVCLNRLRSRRRKPESPLDDLLHFIATDERLEKQLEDRSLLDWIFQREPASTRLIATLHYVDRMTLEEVAETVGMSVSGVRKRLRKLRASATELMGEAA
jgi:RNA polymerase sigma-70 factor, ECF subfamily